ncbi:MAG: phytase [Bryobacteraceae bacterium]
MRISFLSGGRKPMRAAWLFVLCAAAGCRSSQPAAIDMKPAGQTTQAADDPDDPAIWVHPTDSSKSLILGTNKVKAPGGALLVFDLSGAVRQTVSGLDRPNNVDIEYGFILAGKETAIAVVTERLQSRLRVFRIDAGRGSLSDITSLGNTRVFTDRAGEQAAPMGIGLYRRPRDGAIFAIVAPKNGPLEGYLAQYRLEDDGQGLVKATFVRYFGRFSGGMAEIEAVAVDDPLGYVYYADEGDGIHKYLADPDHPDAARELAHFGRAGFQADREGIAIHQRPDGTGYIVCTDQIAGNSEYRLHRREGEPGRPHDHERVVRIVRGGADSTDGIEITSRPLGPRFPSGLMVAMNSTARNFLLFHAKDVIGE